MYYDDHGPPHFHARFGDFRIVVDIDSAAVRGYFPLRKQAVVLAWLRIHRQELLDNWARLRAYEPAARIPPME